MNAHLLPRKLYLVVWAILMLLLAATWGLAELNLGGFSIVAALSIAVVKMVLVILYFMHVRYSSRLTWVVVVSGFFWLAILIALTMSDYLTRPEGWRSFPR